jgi:hypothetical protein
MVAKKKMTKKPTKKPVKKATVKQSKKVSPKKRAVKKVAAKSVAVSPVLDSTGTVVMRAVDDPEEVVDEAKPALLKPTLDKATGAIIMVPVE